MTVHVTEWDASQHIHDRCDAEAYRAAAKELNDPKLLDAVERDIRKAKEREGIRRPPLNSTTCLPK